MPRPKKGQRTPGSGMPKGWKSPQTLDKEAARTLVRERVIASLTPMLDAQITSAIGLRHTFMRDKSGKFVLLTDAKDIETALNSGNEGTYYWTFTKDPSTPAFQSLLDRALDKPKEQPLDVNVNDVTKRPTDELMAEATALLEKLRERR